MGRREGRQGGREEKNEIDRELSVFIRPADRSIY